MKYVKRYWRRSTTMASPIPFYLSPPPMKDAVLQNFALIYSSFLHVRTPRSIVSVWLSTVRLR
ncbi:Uncharacterised protein [Salmonella enterica subsp. enterica serovar Bovismorbificans]|uniref:Uncharacterized protein n=1 Tax=Salmonella enterica subsp. enterica serovar Bovismorbificans TaxID=58097 RepID=A0A655EUB9_SALET|nr:Uncharacterised protein [Salmonella enterica subsp. enterica serovar Bovismorbificans]